MIRTSAPFAFCVLDCVFCILQRQLTEMKEAAVTRDPPPFRDLAPWTRDLARSRCQQKATFIEKRRTMRPRHEVDQSKLARVDL